MGSISELRLAILVNHPPHTTFWPEVKQAFVDAFALVAPHARIDFFDPIVNGDYPNPDDYDLILLSGGKGNSISAEPWILREIDFVKDTVERYPRKKILGVCFGHQIIAQALGGNARNIPSGPIVSHASKSR
jgi:putative intracellular protease/amidase